MTRKDYQLIASVLRRYIGTDYVTESIIEEQAEDFANVLLAENPRFDSKRFISASLGISTKDLA